MKLSRHLLPTVSLTGTKVCNCILLLDGASFAFRHASFYVVLLSLRLWISQISTITPPIEDASCHPIILFVVMFLSPRTITSRIKYALEFKVMATKPTICQGPMPLHPDGDPKDPGLSRYSSPDGHPIGRVWLLVLSLSPYLQKALEVFFLLQNPHVSPANPSLYTTRWIFTGMLNVLIHSSFVWNDESVRDGVPCRLPEAWTRQTKSESDLSALSKDDKKTQR